MLWLCILSIYHFYQHFLSLAFSFPSLSFPSHHSIFCKMSALVRHRVSLFGKMSVSQHQSFWIFSLFSVFLICSCIVLAVIYAVLYAYTGCCDLNSIKDLITAELYLYVQERMLQPLLTVFIFWHGHLMQGLVFCSFSHRLHNAIKMNMFSFLVFGFHYNLSYLLY